MTRKQAISFAAGQCELMTDWKGKRQMIVDMVNALPDDRFDPEDPVADAGLAVLLIARITGALVAEEDVVKARLDKASELLEELLAQD